MAYSDISSGFRKDKINFFSSNYTKTSQIRVRTRSEDHKYKFLAKNNLLIEDELKHLYASLKSDKEAKLEFWLYCYYCCILLQNYYHAYNKPAKVKEFAKLRKELKQHCKNLDEKESEEEESLLSSIGKKIKDNLVELASTPFHIGKLRDRVGYSNILRIYWFFCRTAVTKSFLLADELKIVAKLGNFLGKNINVDQIIKVLEAPSGVLRVLSVGFFVTRFFLNLAMVLKHTLLPTPGEQHLEWTRRLKRELYDRHGTMLNDVVWGVINLVTNYNQLFHIAGSTAGWMVAGFMLFDVSLLFWRRYWAKQEYLAKEAQYNEDLWHYSEKLRGECTPKDRRLFEDYSSIINKQKIQLNIEWNAKNATYFFNILAATLLIAGFSASMLFTPAGLIIASYVLCTIAVSMYLSDGAFNLFWEKRQRLEEAKTDARTPNSANDLKTAQEEYSKARNEFLITMAKNIFIPALFIATYAICWQAALVLTAMYIGYLVWDAYYEHAGKLDAKDSTLSTKLECKSDEDALLSFSDSSVDDSELDDEPIMAQIST